MSASKVHGRFIDKLNLLSDDKLKDSRLKICDECHSKAMRLGEKFCNECNCFLKFKIALKEAKCPLEKW
jgi:hypothetical protein